MTAMEFEISMLMFRTVLRAFKDHCEERECDKCEFADEHGMCILHVTPNRYDLEKIQDAIRRNVRESGENRWV